VATLLGAARKSLWNQTSQKFIFLNLFLGEKIEKSMDTSMGIKTKITGTEKTRVCVGGGPFRSRRKAAGSAFHFVAAYLLFLVARPSLLSSSSLFSTFFSFFYIYLPLGKLEDAATF
jgi:hypothetical protein